MQPAKITTVVINLPKGIKNNEPTAMIVKIIAVAPEDTINKNISCRRAFLSCVFSESTIDNLGKITPWIIPEGIKAIVPSVRINPSSAITDTGALMDANHKIGPCSTIERSIKDIPTGSAAKKRILGASATTGFSYFFKLKSAEVFLKLNLINNNPRQTVASKIMRAHIHDKTGAHAKRPVSSKNTMVNIQLSTETVAS